MENKVILSNLSNPVQAKNRMCYLMYEMVRNGTSSRNGLHANMEKFVQTLGNMKLCDVKFLDNDSSQKDNLLERKANYFGSETMINDHLIERKEFIFDSLFNLKPIIGQETLDQLSTANYFLINCAN